MIQIPSLDWPRRTNPLDGSEDFLKQNPSSDSFPQEERVPSSLLADYVIGLLNFSNVGSGIGTFNFRIDENIQFRSITNASSKVSVGLSSNSILIDVNSGNIASEISLTDLNDVGSPSNPNEFLKFNGTSFVFEEFSPYAITFQDQFAVQTQINNLDYFTINGQAPIKTLLNGTNQIDISFEGSLYDLNNVDVGGSIPNGYILAYDSGDSTWKAAAPSSPATYSFDVRGDDVSSSTINDLDVLSILGSGVISTTLSGTNQITISWAAVLSDISNVSTGTPSNNQVLTFNGGTNQWEPATPSNLSLTTENGISFSSSTITLGGTLNQPTIIDGDGNVFAFSNLSQFVLESSNGGYNSSIEINNNVGLFSLFNTDASSNSIELNLDSANGVGTLGFTVAFTTKKFQTYYNDGAGGLVYELSGNTRAGFIVVEDSIIIIDGVNNPSAGHVLTYMADGTAQFLPTSGGTADDWGAQVVQTDVTLVGDGTLGNPLGVATPIPDGWDNGEYLGVQEGVITWLPFPEEEFVGLCEFEKDSEVSITTGKLYFVVPPQMHGWEIKSYVAAVYTLGSGGTTTVELAKNGTTISGSNGDITSVTYITKTSINNVVSTGDRINLNVTAAKPTKDKGLSLTILFQS